MLAIAVAKYLAETEDDFTYSEAGGDLFIAFDPSTERAVVVMPQPGEGTYTKAPTDTPGLQIIVRHETLHDPLPGYQLARRIYSRLACLDNVTLDEGGDDEVRVIGCDAAQSDPVPMGVDANDRHEFSLNFDFRTVAATAHRPLINT